MDVALLAWPADDARRRAAAVAGEPRLLLVAPGENAPTCDDPLEDWVRLPADPADVRARVATLVRRAASEGVPHPTIDDDGTVRAGAGVVHLPPVQARLAQVLLASPGRAVSALTLMEAAWPLETVSRNTLDVHLSRLRKRLAAIGLAVRSVRGRGWTVERTSD